jgi:Ni,Fe-hydrogenase I large subunit
MYLKGTDGNITLIAHYVKALDIRMKAHRMLTLFGGRMPHVIGLVPGGITQKPTPENIREFSQILDEVEQFVTTCYLPDIFSVVSAFPEYLSAGTFGNFLSYGEFPDCDAPRASYFPAGVIQGDSFPPFSAKNILEYVRYSRYSSGSGLHPSAGETEPQPDKPEAYSWMKAPRYREQPCEVGPLARVLIAYTRGNAEIKKEVDAVLAKCSAGVPVLKSVLGRHAARAIESVVLCRRMKEWLAQLDPAKPPRSTYQIVDASEGMGLAEAPRGALGHWIAVRNKVIDTYQCIVPTTWFCSPRDDTGVAGPVEQALTGTQVKDPGNPIEVVRVVRSFDPCIACAVHVLREKREVGQTLIC